MRDISPGIRILKGTTDILVVAPHGPRIKGRYENDIRTGVVVEEIHHRFGCTAIVNDRFFKPKGPVKKDAKRFNLDLYRIDHSRKVPGYIDAIDAVVSSPGKTFVLWVHGISDQFALARGREHAKIGRFEGPPEALHALIAYGQGGDPKTGDPDDRFTARAETVERFRDLLKTGGMTAIPTHRECDNYRGRDAKRFNQWFLKQGYGFDRVESIQLETKESGFRDTRSNAVKTALIIEAALRGLLTGESGSSEKESSI